MSSGCRRDLESKLPLKKWDAKRITEPAGGRGVCLYQQSMTPRLDFLQIRASPSDSQDVCCRVTPISLSPHMESCLAALILS